MIAPTFDIQAKCNVVGIYRYTALEFIRENSSGIQWLLAIIFEIFENIKHSL